MTDAVLPMSGLTPDAIALLRRLGKIAVERDVGAYVVGGVVRDLLLGGKTGDLDIVVEERAEDFVAAAVSRLGGSSKVYARFGTALYLPGQGAKVDVATARSETYATPGALPDVLRGTISDDLVRRDFTINAMAASIRPEDFGRLIDEHNGQADLRDRVLRVLHEGSFLDDPTRVFRAVRFHARLGFAIAPDTERLLRDAATPDTLDTVSGERLMNELMLMLGETDPSAALLRLVDWRLTEAVRPCWSPDRARVEHLLAGLNRLPACSRLTPLMALLEPVAPVCRADVVDRLRAGRRLRRTVSDLAVYESKTAPVLRARGPLDRSRIHELLRGRAMEVLELALADDPVGTASNRIRLYTNELAGVETALSGGDLIALGFPQGEEVGNALDALRRARLDGVVSTREDEERFARNMLASMTQREAGLDEGRKSC